MDVIGYFKYMAVHLKVFLHQDDPAGSRSFFRVSGLAGMEELLTNPKCKDHILMIEDQDDGSFVDPGHNVIDERIVSGYILERVKDSTDFDALQTARAKCKSTMIKILSRLNKDGANWHNNSKGLRGFDIYNFRYYSVGPLGQTFHGIRFSFTLDEQCPLVENPSDWQGES